MKQVFTRVNELGEDTRACLVHTFSGADGLVHAAWELPDGKVFSFEDSLTNYPSGGYTIKESRAAYWRSMVGVSWIPGAPEEPPGPIMYNSHGVRTTLQEIYEIETERGNDTFETVNPEWLKDHLQCLAIWATTEPLSAWKYAIDAEEWNLPDKELAAKYPNCIEDVEHIDTSGMVCIAEDGDDGYLLVDMAESTGIPISTEPYSKLELRLQPTV